MASKTRQVDNKSRTGFPWRPLVLACLLIASAICCVWTRYQVTSLGYDIFESNSRLDSALMENQKLGLERSHLRSPDRLQKKAGRLGLVEPSADQMLKVP